MSFRAVKSIYRCRVNFNLKHIVCLFPELRAKQRGRIRSGSRVRFTSARATIRIVFIDIGLCRLIFPGRLVVDPFLEKGRK